MLLPLEVGYRQALADLLQYGITKPTFNSENTCTSLFGRTLLHEHSYGFPIYSGKKVNWRWAIAEMLMFVKGKPTSWLSEQGINIWDKWDATAPVHYHNFTNWAGTDINQTDWAMQGIIKSPYRKSYVVSGWNPSQVYEMAIGKSVALPCCHLLHQLVCNTPGELNMFVLIRSNDMALGNPFNVAQYGALHHMYVHCLNNRQSEIVWKPADLLFQLVDYHYYGDTEQGIREYLASTVAPEQKAKLNIKQRGQTNLADFELADFELEGYAPGKYIKMPLHAAGGY